MIHETITNGELAEQSPVGVTTYTFADLIAVLPTVTRVKPEGDGSELHLKLRDGNLVVYGGIDGARYAVTLEDGQMFWIRVTSRPDAITRPPASPGRSLSAEPVRRKKLT